MAHFWCQTYCIHDSHLVCGQKEEPHSPVTRPAGGREEPPVQRAHYSRSAGASAPFHHALIATLPSVKYLVEYLGNWTLNNTACYEAVKLCGSIKIKGVGELEKVTWHRDQRESRPGRRYNTGRTFTGRKQAAPTTDLERRLRGGPAFCSISGGHWPSILVSI